MTDNEVTGRIRPGHLVGGRYRLLEPLGSGGFGQVWKARDEALGVVVAVKGMWLPPGADAELGQRLARAEREARNAARLRDHPNIVTVHDVVIEDGVPWIVMRLVTGRSLEDRLRAGGPLPEPEAAHVAAGLLNALGAAHAAGILHRDVKPANVMLAENGDVLLTDFGIAVHQADTALTATGLIIGSAEYLAPERADGADGDAASDLFSLGVTLYRAVEGLSPFRRDSPSGTLRAVIMHDPPPPQRAGGLAPLITALLSKNPAARPSVPRALEMIGAPSLPTRTLRPVHGRRNALIAGGCAAALVGAAAVVLVATAGGGHKDHPSATRLHPAAAKTTTAPPAPVPTDADGLPDPCQTPDDTTKRTFKLWAGQAQGTGKPGTGKPWLRVCRWYPPGWGDGYLMLAYGSLEVSVQNGGKPSPPSVTGLPSSAQMVSSSYNCLIQWPASFGNVAVNAYAKNSSVTDLCGKAGALAQSVAPRIPK
ncbi:serine/threonine-protein kinase [Actinomadura violacea]|uniref:non-specific serine/threonine protein kinase n=1 Tax=Actinomadura violacea TaxID=2819934 RepID=A0ABS3S6C4_9ACTN|nr:serine/threonine-protein kinase [Actinomadura violacea]MBO2464563.1 protein kinase [Actinomadura violacea]